MKKKSFFYSLLLVLFFLVSCYENPVYIKNTSTDLSITSKISYNYGSDLALYDSLLDFSVFNDYLRTEEDLENDIRAFIKSFNGLKNVDGFTFDNVENIQINQNIRLCIYNVFYTDSEKKFFIIIPNDRRIGDVLFISDDSIWEELKDNDGIKELILGFTEYSEKVLSEWDKISYEEISNQKNKYTSMSKDITLDSSVYREYGNWVQYGSDTFIKTEDWVQSSFYNDAIEKVYNTNGYLVGCGPLAIGLIMNYWKYPEAFVDISGKKANLSLLKSVWPEYNDWNGYYDWDSINNGTNHFQTAALLLDVAEQCNTSYSVSGSGIFLEDISRCLDFFNFSYEEVDNPKNSLAGILSITSSIENEMPVICTSKSHVFIIDGSKLMLRDCVFRRYTIGVESVTYEPVTVTEQQSLYYHVNMGWGSDAQTGGMGWYNPSAVVGGHSCNHAFCNIKPAN